VLVINGADDGKIPESAARKLLLAAGGPAEQIWLTGGHIHPSNEKLISSLTNRISQWLKNKGLL
jgi:hypothetical protein